MNLNFWLGQHKKSCQSLISFWSLKKRKLSFKEKVKEKINSKLNIQKLTFYIFCFSCGQFEFLNFFQFLMTHSQVMTKV